MDKKKIWEFDSSKYAAQLRTRNPHIKDDDENTVYHPFFESAYNETRSILLAQMNLELDQFSQATDAVGAATPTVHSTITPGTSFEFPHLLQHTYKSDVFVSTHHHPDFALVMARYAKGAAAPTHAITAFVEIKKMDFVDADIRQALEYGRRLLQDQPRRVRVFVALCNNKIMQWFSVTLTDDFLDKITYDAFQREVIASEAGISMLLSVMDSSLGFASPLAVKDPRNLTGPTYFAERFLGRGAFAVVYAASCSEAGRPPVVLKTYCDQAPAHIEADALAMLTGIVGIPILLFGCAHYDSSWVNCIAPVADSLDRKLTALEVVDLIDTLQCVHTKGWVCRDVRPANIMMVDRRAYLVDWNAAIRLLPSSSGTICRLKSAPTTKFAGTLRYASNSLLTAMANDTAYEYSAADDLVALARVVISQVRGLRVDIAD